MHYFVRLIKQTEILSLYVAQLQTLRYEISVIRVMLSISRRDGGVSMFVLFKHPGSRYDINSCSALGCTFIFRMLYVQTQWSVVPIIEQADVSSCAMHKRSTTRWPQ